MNTFYQVCLSVRFSHQVDWTADVTVHQEHQAVDQVTGRDRERLY